MTDTKVLTTPLELYFSFKESPTNYWVAKIQSRPYLGTTDNDPYFLEPNICGPIVDPTNVSFVDKLEPGPNVIDKLAFVSSYSAIMIVDSYQQVQAFHKVSVDFSQRLKLGEILRETLDAEGNEALKQLFQFRKTPAFFTKESTTPLEFVRYRREVTYQVIYEILRDKIKDVNGDEIFPDDYIYQEGNRYKTCSGTVKFGRTLDIRRYTFDFNLKDFSRNDPETSFDATFGISKILEGDKITSNPTIPGPYRLKVFFEKENKNQVQTQVEGKIPINKRYTEIDGLGEIVYRIFPSITAPELTTLIVFLNGFDLIVEWGMGGPDTIYKFQTGSDVVVISERPLTLLDPEEDVMEQLLDNIQLTEGERDQINAEYQAFLEENPIVQDSPDKLEQWYDDGLRRKRQVLYFDRKTVRPPKEDDPYKEVAGEVSNDTFSGSAPKFERYNATGEIPLTVYGSVERALDEAKQTILKEFVTIELPNGSSTVEYMDYLIGTYRKYHSNGFLWRVETYKNETRAMKSLLDGRYLEFFEDGRRSIIGGFQDDLLHGAYREFYRNTIPKCQGTLRRGKLNGLYVQWDDEGNRLFKAYFIGGALNNSYVLDYQVFASTPCLSRNGIYVELQVLFSIKEAYTFTEIFNVLIAKDLLDIDTQPDRQLLAVLNEVAFRISGGVDHGKYKLRDNVILN